MTLLLVGTQEQSADPSIYGEVQARFPRACYSRRETMTECLIAIVDDDTGREGLSKDFSGPRDSGSDVFISAEH
jgi:hypothetical protein